MSFDYFYNREAEQYIHYTMPKMFFCYEQLRSLSVNAKFLYAILLDRAKLSFKNGFIDDDGKVYIHFTQAEIMKLLNCGRTKVSEYFGELDEPKGVGLIERKQKTGIGKSDRIYVKNFAKPLDGTCRSSDDKAPFSRFAYFHDMENLRFENYQVPKTLFLDEQISQISNIAKMAYSIMLDRTKLSMSKGWQDKDGRIYIIFPQKELQEILGCSLKTVNSALKELDTKSGVGLIERTRQGMNNPDIIYVLDYSTDLKYKPQTQNLSEPDSQDIQSVNIGDVKTEHREVQNLNIGSVKTEHREVQNLNIGDVKSEHLIYNNTDNNNTDFIDTHSINQSSASENANTNSERVIDGLIDKAQNIKNKELSFSEILKAIEFPDYCHDFQTEADFYEYYGKSYDEFPENELQKCTVPYWIIKNPKNLEQVLKFIFEYECCEKRETKELICIVIQSLLFMLKDNTYVLNKKNMTTVNYNQIIDSINQIMHSSSLMDWLEDFKTYWGKALSDYKPKNPEPYFRSCIWKSMNDFQFRDLFKDNSGCWQAEYDIASGKIYEQQKSRKKQQCCPEENAIPYQPSENDYTAEQFCEPETSESPANRTAGCNTSKPHDENHSETENTADTNKSEQVTESRYSDGFIVDFLLTMAIKSNKTLSHYLKDYPYPLPNGLTLNSPNDLTKEKIRKLEVEYGVRQ